MAENWDDLRVFLEVARAENLSAAARVLRIDPATAGRRIARLEHQYGTALFRKSPQGYVLTETGQQLASHTEEMARVLRGAGQAMFDPGAELAGQIRIGAPDGCATFLLPQVCAAIAEEHPELDVQIVAQPRVFNLSKREADMAITVSPPETGRLSVQKLCDYHLHLAAAATYLDGAPRLRELGDLKAHKIIGYIPDLIFDRELDYLSETGASHVDFASNSASVQFAWVRSGAGIGIVHDFAIPQSMGAVRPVLPSAFSLTRSFYLVRHADDARDARLNRFSKALLARLPDELGQLEALAHQDIS